MAILPAAAAPETPVTFGEGGCVAVPVVVGQGAERTEKRGEGAAPGIPYLLQMIGDLVLVVIQREAGLGEVGAGSRDRQLVSGPADDIVIERRFRVQGMVQRALGGEERQREAGQDANGVHRELAVQRGVAGDGQVVHAGADKVGIERQNAARLLR